MRTFRRIAVFCGSSDAADPVYHEAARALGRGLAERGIGVVYGGGRVGLMGAVADGALEAGGQVYGVIPEKLRALEVDHLQLTECFVVDSMHARKAMMAHLSDAFIALPGGYGTLDELFEAVTWTQLNYHLKPVGLLNVRGYFDQLLAFLQHAVGEGFIRQMHAPLVTAAESLDDLLQHLATVDLPEIGRWIEKP